uniref:WH2 domain-containing protein n=1 Tax=Strongyloides papillosus TaxID=174720 RepID=A0A0N5BI52_STREA
MEHSGPMSASTYGKRNNAAEVLRRKQAAEKEQEIKLQQKLREKEEKSRRAAEAKDQELREKTRKIHEKELLRQKMVLDRRAAQLEQDSKKKMEILTKAHAATSRLVCTKTGNGSPQQKKVYAFGSSTPRDLVYLEKLSREQKVYNNKLVAPASSSGKSSQGQSTTPSPNKMPIRSNVAFGSSMTSSLYVSPSQKVLPVQRSPLNPVPLRKGPSSTNNTPNRNTNNVPPPPRRSVPRVSNSMTQSMYTPRTSVGFRSNTTLKGNGTLNGQLKPNLNSTQARNVNKVPLPHPPKKNQQMNGDVKKVKNQMVKPKDHDTVTTTQEDKDQIHHNVSEEFHSVERNISLESLHSHHEDEVTEVINDVVSAQVNYSIEITPEITTNNNEEFTNDVEVKSVSPAPVPETLKLPEKLPILEDENSPEPVSTLEENKFDSGVDSETPNDADQIVRNSIGVNSLTSALAQMTIRTPASKKTPEEVSTLPHSSSSSSSSNEDLASIYQMKSVLKAQIQKQKDERENRSARIKALLSKVRGSETSDPLTTGTTTSLHTSISPILNIDKKVDDDTTIIGPTTSDLGVSVSTAKTLEKLRRRKEKNSEMVSSTTSTPVVEKSIAEELSSLGVNLPGQPTYDYPPEDPKVNGGTFTSQTAAST